MSYSITDTSDAIEDAIILALHAKNTSSFSAKGGEKNKKSGFTHEALDLATFCPRKRMYPLDMFAAGLVGNGDRLFSTDFDHLVCDPIKLIGRRIESVILGDDGSCRWIGIEPMPAPRGLVAMSNHKVSWFAVHLRVISRNLTEEYQVRPLPIAGRKVPKVKALGWPGDGDGWLQDISQKAALALSSVEDAMRSGSMLATVHEHARLRFAVGEEGYKSFFAMRDGHRDTPTGRRNPILHWCADHIRKRGDKAIYVSAHDRGAEEIRHGAMTLTIERNTGYGAFL